MNLDNSTLPNFGSGNTSRFGTSLRLGILNSLKYIQLGKAMIIYQNNHLLVCTLDLPAFQAADMPF